MNSGDLRELITLLIPGEDVIDSRGHPIPQWVELKKVRAKITDVSGRDFYAAQAYHAQDTVTFGIRWVKGLVKPLRIRYEATIFEVEEINHLGYRRDFVHLKARAVKGLGV